jgi:hypothetical protein
MMRTLPLTVLFHEGPMARAYLEMLRQCGVRPRKIVHLLPRSGPLSRMLPRGVRATGLARKQEQAANYWPRALSAQFPALTATMTSMIEAAFDLDTGFLDRLRSGAGLERYCGTVEVAESGGFKDPAFISILQNQPPGLLLFTGGGILPPAVFDVPHIRFLHVHPGYLPHVRGADGLLWSTLLRGQPGASAFIMQPGLDVGDLVEAMEMEPLHFPTPDDEYPDDQSLYRLIFSLYDPVVRACVLRKILPLLDDPDALRGRPQAQSEGETYHFMGPRMRHRALGAIFIRGNSVI